MSKNSRIAIIALVAFGAGYYLRNKRKENSAPEVVKDETIKSGDFSKEVEKLQSLINRLFGSEVVKVTGAYDKKTKEVVKIIFYDTKELINLEQGEVTVKGISLLNKVLDNIQPQKKEENEDN